MRIAHAPGQLERQPRAVAIGTFDGVHRGHLSVIQAAVDSGLAPTVITFDPHPRVALGNEVELITTLERRLELFASLGVESTLVAPFTTELMALQPETFAERYLSAIGATAVAAGPNFRFGAKRCGDRDLLGELGFEILDVVPVPGVSSSAIRAALREGDVGEAAALLGRPFELDGVVVAGDQRGGTLGYPTANLALEPRLACPCLRDLRRLGARAPRCDLDRDEPALRRPGAPDRAVPARLRGRSLRQAAHRRGVGAAARRRRCSRPRRSSIAQIGRDVEATRAATRPAPPA